jgi:rare lipoprotein A
MSIITVGCAPKVPQVKDPQRPAYTIRGKTYYPERTVRAGRTEQGVASWYGPGFHGKKTSSGEAYDMHAMTAAHTVLPLNTVVKVTNLENRKEIVVRINDRGPFVGDRVIDLSLAAAKELGMVRPGTAPVKVTVLGPSDTKQASRVDSSTAAAPSAGGPNPFFAGRRGWLATLVGR